jgi:hypothetical protein
MLPRSIFLWEKMDNVDTPPKIPTIRECVLYIVSFEHGLGEILKCNTMTKNGNLP